MVVVVVVVVVVRIGNFFPHIDFMI